VQNFDIAPDPRGALRYVSLLGLLPPGERHVGQVERTLPTPDGFLFLTTRALILWDGARIVKVASFPGDRPLAVAYRVDGAVYLWTRQGIVQLAGRRLVPVRGGEASPSTEPRPPAATARSPAARQARVRCGARFFMEAGGSGRPTRARGSRRSAAGDAGPAPGTAAVGVGRAGLAAAADARAKERWTGHELRRDAVGRRGRAGLAPPGEERGEVEARCAAGVFRNDRRHGSQRRRLYGEGGHGAERQSEGDERQSEFSQHGFSPVHRDDALSSS
jgi:hypothetical protein